MGAVAISQSDEKMLQSLQKALKLPSKAQVLHRALEELNQAVAREKLSLEIRRSVARCAKADLQEHQALSSGAAYRSRKE